MLSRIRTCRSPRCRGTSLSTSPGDGLQPSPGILRVQSVLLKVDKSQAICHMRWPGCLSRQYISATSDSVLRGGQTLGTCHFKTCGCHGCRQPDQLLRSRSSMLTVNICMIDAIEPVCWPTSPQDLEGSLALFLAEFGSTKILSYFD